MPKPMVTAKPQILRNENSIDWLIDLKQHKAYDNSNRFMRKPTPERMIYDVETR